MMDCKLSKIPAVTADQMSEIDRVATAEIGIELLQMMELAGHHLATLARSRFLGGDPRQRRVLVLAGSGGNGGGGMVAARRLAGWCASVEIWLTRAPSQLTGAAAHQCATLRQIAVPLHPPTTTFSLPPADLIIDALIGYSLDGPPAGPAAALIQAANDHPAPVLSLDVPSGADATTGTVFAPCMVASATLALALPKSGLWSPWMHDVTGELYVADIGVPEAVYARLGLAVGPIFARHETLRIG